MVYMYVHYVYIVGAHVVHINGEGLEPSVCVCVCVCVCACAHVLKALALVPGHPRPFHIQVCAIRVHFNYAGRETHM